MSSNQTKLALLLALVTMATTGRAIAADVPTDVHGDPVESAQMKKAEVLYKAENFKGASDAYREVIRTEPSNAKAHQRLGAVLAGLAMMARDEKTRKDLDETAELEEKQAIKLDAKSYLPHVVLGHIYANRIKFEDAINEFKTAATLKPDSFNTQLDLGRTYMVMGNGEESLKSYRKAIEMKPDKAAPYINIGVVQQNMGDFKGAIESEKKALTLQKSPYEKQAASLNLGNVYADSGDPDNAIKFYQDAYKLNPQDLMPLSGIGWMQASKGEFDAAIDTQRTVLKKAGKDSAMQSIARARMATAMAKKGQTKEAEQEFQKVVTTKPTHPVAVMEYGYFLEKAGRKSEAKTQFENALTLQPTFKPAKEALAKLDSSKTETK